MKAIILAAGHGTRMLPITKTIPKEMLPVGTKPVIHYIVEGLSKAGIRDIVMVTSQSKKAIEDYFDKHYELESLLDKKWKTEALTAIREPLGFANITFVRQSEMKGTGHAILQARPWIEDDFFMVLNGDEIHHPKVYQEMIALHQETGKGVMLAKNIPWPEISRYGVFNIKDGHIVDIVEKPAAHEAPSQYANFTPYIFPREVLDLLVDCQPDPISGEIYPRWAVKPLMAQKKIIPYMNTHPMRDACGNPQSWLETNIAFANNPRILD